MEVLEGKETQIHARVLACGDTAVTLELSDRIDEVINSKVIALAAELAAQPPDGMKETIPTYRSLTVVYDPRVIAGSALSADLLRRVDALSVSESSGRVLYVPVSYGGQVGSDLAELAEIKKMSAADVIELHASAQYRVYMIGFAPGFAYLGGLPAKLHTPRLAVPRQRIEAGAVGIGGKQANITSVPGPSGWRYIGRTPARLFDPGRQNPFLLRAGDSIRFRQIDDAEARDLDKRIAAGALGVEELRS
jgi:KipI family sensor histidine kinase inhibitor